MFKFTTLNSPNPNHLFFKFKNTYFLVFKNLLFHYFFLFSLLFLTIFFYMTIGSFSISYSNIFSTLANYFLLQEVKGEIANIIINIRLPRLIMAILLGSSLGVCGLLLQSYVKNNFASPSMLGISDGAVTAVLICIILYPSLPILYYPFIGILGGMSVGIFMFLVYFFFLPTSLNLILIGIGLKSFLDSIATIFITYSDISLVFFLL